MKRRWQQWWLLAGGLGCLLVLVACMVQPASQPAPTVAATTIPLTPTRTDATATALLPAPLYLIGQDNNQILRIESDGKTVTQITTEAGPVADFDVSPQDGHLVYVSENNLIASDAWGQQRRVLLHGPQVEESRSDLALARYGPVTTVATPRFSPDGAYLAYGLGGVNLMPVDQPAQSRLIEASDPYTPTDQTPNHGFFYVPERWSPGGTRLLVTRYNYWEGVGYGVKRIAEPTAPLTILQGCCYVSWRNEDELYMSLPEGEVFPPGLWRLDAASGQATALLSLEQQSAITRVGPTLALPGESLLAFAVAGTPQTPIPPLSLYRLQFAGTTLQPYERLRDDEYRLWEARWAADASGVVIVQRTEDAPPPDRLFRGPLLWLSTDGAPAVTLPAVGFQLRWGRP